ncbi:MAG: hypothetical protein ABIY55_13905, partial [Kofleriaceae bacterium]
MNKSKRKIQLSRETVRVLTSGHLGGIAGGGPTTNSVLCDSDVRCPFPSQRPCSIPCAQSEGLRCYGRALARCPPRAPYWPGRASKPRSIARSTAAV